MTIAGLLGFGCGVLRVGWVWRVFGFFGFRADGCRGLLAIRVRQLIRPSQDVFFWFRGLGT